MQDFLKSACLHWGVFMVIFAGPEGIHSSPQRSTLVEKFKKQRFTP